MIPHMFPIREPIPPEFIVPPPPRSDSAETGSSMGTTASSCGETVVSIAEMRGSGGSAGSGAQQTLCWDNFSDVSSLNNYDFIDDSDTSAGTAGPGDEP